MMGRRKANKFFPVTSYMHSISAGAKCRGLYRFMIDTCETEDQKNWLQEIDLITGRRRQTQMNLSWLARSLKDEDNRWWHWLKYGPLEKELSEQVRAKHISKVFYRVNVVNGDEFWKGNSLSKRLPMRVCRMKITITNPILKARC